PVLDGDRLGRAELRIDGDDLGVMDDQVGRSSGIVRRGCRGGAKCDPKNNDEPTYHEATPWWGRTNLPHEGQVTRPMRGEEGETAAGSSPTETASADLLCSSDPANRDPGNLPGRHRHGPDRHRFH